MSRSLSGRYGDTPYSNTWELSNTLESSFCVKALERALLLYGQPEIFNSDQGSQFTSTAFTSILLDAGVRISMDKIVKHLYRRYIDKECVMSRLLKMMNRHDFGKEV